jgi:hypothetical protein
MKDLFTITPDRSNKDIPGGMTRHEAKDYYLQLYGDDFKSKLPDPKILLEKYEDKYVLRFDLSPAGFKAFAAEKLIANCDKDVLVYVSPRVGHAPQAIAELAKQYGKKCVFFIPASKQVSKHQAVLAAYGADLRFIKTPAMPTINIYAKRWAEANNAQYLSFGLSGMPDVTAGIVKVASMLPEPPEFWCAVSTGTMIRGLQIGWPNSIPRGVAVARNIHKGELGDAIVESAKIPFLKPVKDHELPEFQTTATYDAKAFAKFKKEAKPGSYFINVGADAEIERYYSQVNVDEIDSQREWGDMRDLER